MRKVLFIEERWVHSSPHTHTHTHFTLPLNTRGRLRSLLIFSSNANAALISSGRDRHRSGCCRSARKSIYAWLCQRGCVDEREPCRCVRLCAWFIVGFVPAGDPVLVLCLVFGGSSSFNSLVSMKESVDRLVPIVSPTDVIVTSLDSRCISSGPLPPDLSTCICELDASTAWPLAAVSECSFSSRRLDMTRCELMFIRERESESVRVGRRNGKKKDARAKGEKFVVLTAHLNIFSSFILIFFSKW